MLKPYARVYRHGTPRIEGFFIQHEGLIGWLGDDERLQEYTYSGMLDEDRPKTWNGIKGGWLGFTDKYWAVALVPDQSKSYSAQFWAPSRRTGTTVESFQTDYQEEPVTLVSGGYGKGLVAGLCRRQGSEPDRAVRSRQLDP